MDQESLEEQIRLAWGANARMNEAVIEAVSDAGLGCTLSKRGGRGAGGELAHMHTNRVWQLQKRAPDLAEGLKIYDAKWEPVRAELLASHRASADAVERLLIGQLRGEPKRRGFKRGVLTTLCYFVSHESHHRGRILLTLKVSGETLDKTTVYRLWDWDRT